jgi:hypothetical protein
MGTRIEIATAPDDAGIRSLLRREPVPGRIAITYRREPDFSIGCQATGENVSVLVARDTDDGSVIGVACRSQRPVYVNGRETSLGYLGQLRIDHRYRGRWLVSRGFSLLKQLHMCDPLPGYLVAITSGNREAAGVLVEKPRRDFPSFHFIADYCTLAFPAGGAKAASRAMVAMRGYEPGDLASTAQFLQREGRRRQFFPVWTEERLRNLIGRLGLRLEDIQVARRGGEIAGVMALWDQSAYKQNVVHEYAGWTKIAAPLYNFGAPWMGRPRLPKPGETLRCGYAALVSIAHDDLNVFRELLAATLNRAASYGLDYLMLGLDARDPLLPVARENRHVLYPSRIYLAQWRGGCSLDEQPDERPSYVEIATL